MSTLRSFWHRMLRALGSGKLRSFGRGMLRALGILGAAAIVVTIIVSIALVIIASLGDNWWGGAWAPMTGPIGDTFGGILGPILNAAVLVTTVYLAVVWQPKRNREDAEERADLERASLIVAWVATTDDRSHLGVVVTNASDSVAHNVDILVRRADAPAGASPVPRDREAVVPPGTWFIPLKLGQHANPWEVPVSVDTDGRLSVTLDSADATAPASVTLTLRPHLPEIRDQRPEPHYELAELRYELHGKSWLRGANGLVAEAPELTGEEHTAREAMERTPRSSARAMSKRVNSDIEELMRFTFATVCESADDAFDGAVTSPQPVNQLVLPGVDSIARNAGGGGTMDFHLVGGQRRLRVHQNAKQNRYPAGVYVIDNDDNDFYDGTRLLGGQAAIAGARAIGMKRASELRGQETGRWLTPGGRAQWILVLRELARAAAGHGVARAEHDGRADAAGADASEAGVDETTAAAASGPVDVQN